MSPAASDLIANQDPGFDPRESNTNLVAMWDSDYLTVADGDELAEFRDCIGDQIGTAEGNPSHSVIDEVEQWDFDGNDDFLMPYDSASLVNGQTQITVSAWINMDAWVKNSYIMASSDSGRKGVAVRVGLNTSPYQGLVFYVMNGYTSGATWYTGAWASLGSWDHVCCRWNNADGSEIWVNGSPIATNTAALLGSSIAYSGNFPVIGAGNDGGGGGINGQLTNIQIWDAYFSPSSIITASQSPSVTPSQIPETGLKIWYKGTKDDSWHDATGNGNDATAVNNPTREAAR